VAVLLSSKDVVVVSGTVEGVDEVLNGSVATEVLVKVVVEVTTIMESVTMQRAKPAEPKPVVAMTAAYGDICGVSGPWWSDVDGLSGDSE
jgi:hypothetical protein